jgi:hypothetical protein
MAQGDQTQCSASSRPERRPVKGPMAIFVRRAINTCGRRPWVVLGTLGT